MTEVLEKRHVYALLMFLVALIVGLLAMQASTDDVGFQREDKSGFSCPYYRASLDAGEITFQEYVDAGCS